MTLYLGLYLDKNGYFDLKAAPYVAFKIIGRNIDFEFGFPFAKMEVYDTSQSHIFTFVGFIDEISEISYKLAPTKEFSLTFSYAVESDEYLIQKDALKKKKDTPTP